MSRSPFLLGCTPRAASVLVGAVMGFLALSLSGRDLMSGGIVWLLVGYAVGAFGGYVFVIGLGALVGEWWHE